MMPMNIVPDAVPPGIVTVRVNDCDVPELNTPVVTLSKNTSPVVMLLSEDNRT
jgi:hypothetical protein